MVKGSKTRTGTGAAKSREQPQLTAVLKVGGLVRSCDRHGR